ncbi:MAG: potassium-transporting ATPase subunit KdpA, partial [Halobacteriota archaeon]
MDVVGIIQIIVVLVIALLLIRPTGRYLTGVYFREYNRLDQFFEPVERGVYRIIGIDSAENMSVWRYVLNLLLLNGATFVIMLIILLSQSYLPLNPTHAPNMAIDQAFNTAASFTTNTDWQSYVGEVQLSYLSQMAGVTFLMFTAAASGMAVAAAFIRGFARRERGTGYREITG